MFLIGEIFPVGYENLPLSSNSLLIQNIERRKMVTFLFYVIGFQMEITMKIGKG
jgi:hypothetical protein